MNGKEMKFFDELTIYWYAETF